MSNVVEMFQTIADNQYNGQVTIVRAGSRWYTSFGIVDSPREVLFDMAEGHTLEESMRVAINYDVSADRLLMSSRMDFDDDTAFSVEFDY